MPSPYRLNASAKSREMVADLYFACAALRYTAVMDYAKDVLVGTDWVAAHLQDPHVRLIEVDEDILLYATGHIPGAVKVDWQQDFWHPYERDFISPEEVQSLLGKLGIHPDDTIILYGDKSNWWASYAYWFLSYSGVKNLKLMNGGRQKWVAEGREMTEEDRKSVV